MPRANFQTSDYSTLFADIYKQSADKAKAQSDNVQSAADSDMYDKWQNKVISDAEWLAYISTRLAATAADTDPTDHQRWVNLQRQVQTRSSKEAEDAAKAKQDAEDSDEYDKWKNGLISNQEWLDYIGQRVAATKADTEDPGTYEKWVQLQRQYTSSIADSEAQDDYESGRTSAAQYIAYLKKSLVGMDSGSQAYRERQLSITKLIDTQVANDTTSRAREITEGIKSGRNTYEQLLALYEGAARKARAGSDLANQIAEKIGAVKDAISQNAIKGDMERIDYLFKSGRMTGAQAGKEIRAIAEKNFKGDKPRYYETLLGALQYEKYKGLYSAGSGGGGGGAEKAQKTLISQLRANIKRGDRITNLALNGEKEIYDSAAGKNISGDAKTIHGVQMQTLETFDKLWQVYDRAGKSTEAAGVMDAKAAFIKKVQAINTVGLAPRGEHMITTAAQAITSAAKASNDPLVILSTAREWADKLDAYADSVTTTTKRIALYGVTAATAATDRPLAQYVDEFRAWAKALRTVAAPGATAESVAAEIGLLKKTTGTFIPDSVLTPVLKTIAQQNADWTGLQEGTRVLYMGARGPSVVDAGDTQIGLSGITEKRPKEGADGVGRLGKGEALTQIYADVNGVPTLVWAKMTPVKSDYLGWQAQTSVSLEDAEGNTWHFKKGDFIPSSLIGKSAPPKNRGKKNETLGMTWADYLQSGAVSAQPVNLRWMAIATGEYTDNGKVYAAKVWYGDPVTGTWTVGHPPVVGDMNPDGTIRLDDSQAPSIIYKPLGTAGSVPVVYVGSNNKAMQGIYDTDEAGGKHSGLQSVDALGNVGPAAPGAYSRVYYDPWMDALRSEDASTFSTTDDDWWKPGIQGLKVSRSRREALDQFRLQTNADRQNRGAAFDPKGLTAGLASFGKSLGITGSGFGSDERASDTLPSVPPPIPLPTSVTGSRGTGAPQLTTISQPNSAASLGNIPLPAPTPIRTTVSSVKLPDVHVSTTTTKISVPPPPTTTTTRTPSQDLIGTGHPATTTTTTTRTPSQDLIDANLGMR